MKVANQDYLCQRIYDMLGQHSKKEVSQHFRLENIALSTIYSIFKRFESGMPSSGVKKSGRPKVLTSIQLKRLHKAAKRRKGASNRKLGRKFGISKETVRENLLKSGIKYHKRLTVSKNSEKELEEVPKKCRLLRRNYFVGDVDVILDDGKYFTFAWNNGDKNSGFCTNNIKDTSDSIRFAAKTKFEPKVLVWADISSKGISQLYLQDFAAPAIKNDTYIQKCLKYIFSVFS